MRIVEIIPHLTSGGAERFTVDLCNELAEKHEVWLVLFFPLSNTKLHFLLPEVSERVNVISLDKNMGFDLRMIGRLRRTIKDIAPDIVHCHTIAFQYTFLACLKTSKPRFFYTVHNDAEKDAGRWPMNWMRKFAFKSRKFTPITISEESRNSFRSYYGMDAPMIMNGRHFSNTLPRREGKGGSLVSLARFSKVKRQDMLARIAKRLEDEGYNFKLQFIGQHQDEEMLRKVQKVECHSIEIVGEVNNPLDYLSKADAFCLCSTYEGMPISLIEAMAIGAVPVCTPVGGIVNMVKDGINGYLSEDTSEESYYKALKRFLDTPQEKIAEMSAQAVEAAKPYSMEECAKKYENLWSESTSQRVSESTRQLLDRLDS